MEDELKEIGQAYKEGEPFVFVNGKKYVFKDLNEIRVFTCDDPDLYRSFMNTPSFDERHVGMGRGYHLPIKVLASFGDDVTREILGNQHVDRVVDVAYSTANKAQEKKLKDLKIFISHSSADLAIVEGLVGLIRSALNLTASDIRCTSLDGHKLPSGANTDDTLKKEIFQCEVFIGVLTRASVLSTYVLLELGARWGSNQPFLPLIADARGTELLGGPLKGIHTPLATSVPDLHQFITDLGAMLNIKPENAAVYHRKVEKLCELAKMERGVDVGDVTVAFDKPIKSLSVEARSLLSSSGSTSAAQFIVTESRDGYSISTANETLVESKEGRVVAKWKGVVREVIDAGLAESVSPGSPVYQLTAEGFKYLDNQ